jgi:hypothetical protein
VIDQRRPPEAMHRRPCRLERGFTLMREANPNPALLPARTAALHCAGPMDTHIDPSSHRAVREFLARFATQFSETALLALAARLLRSESTRARWEVLVGEVVACAVYNKIPLEAAERLVLPDS